MKFFALAAAVAALALSATDAQAFGRGRCGGRQSNCQPCQLVQHQPVFVGQPVCQSRQPVFVGHPVVSHQHTGVVIHAGFSPVTSHQGHTPAAVISGCTTGSCHSQGFGFFRGR